MSAGDNLGIAWHMLLPPLHSGSISKGAILHRPNLYQQLSSSPKSVPLRNRNMALVTDFCLFHCTLWKRLFAHLLSCSCQAHSGALQERRALNDPFLAIKSRHPFCYLTCFSHRNAQKVLVNCSPYKAE